MSFSCTMIVVSVRCSSTPHPYCTISSRRKSRSPVEINTRRTHLSTPCSQSPGACSLQIRKAQGLAPTNTFDPQYAPSDPSITLSFPSRKDSAQKISRSNIAEPHFPWSRIVLRDPFPPTSRVQGDIMYAQFRDTFHWVKDMSKGLVDQCATRRISN